MPSSKKSGSPKPTKASAAAKKPAPPAKAATAAAKPAAGKPATGKLAADKPATGKPVAGKPAASKPTAAPKSGVAPAAKPSAGAASKVAKVPAAPAKKKAVAAAPPAPPPPPPAPRKIPKGGPGKADLKRYRDLLLARRRELLSSSKELAAEALQAGGGEFSVDHMADHGSDNYEQDFNLKLLEGEADQLADIRDALLKIDGKGELPFGLCEGCADEAQGRCPTCPWIPASRLDAIPHARLCVQMKEREERNR